MSCQHDTDNIDVRVLSTRLHEGPIFPDPFPMCEGFKFQELINSLRIVFGMSPQNIRMVLQDCSYITAIPFICLCGVK